MGVGPADAERAHTGAERTAAGVPRPASRVHDERRVVEIELRVGRLEMQRRRQRAVMQRQGRLDQTGHAGRRIEMADIGLECADRAAAIADRAAGAERLGQARDLDRIAETRAGAMGFDVGDCIGVDAGKRLRGCDDLCVALDARCGEADLCAAIVVEGGALDDGIDAIVGCDGVCEAAQHDNAKTVAEDGARGVRIERAAVTVWRRDGAFLRRGSRAFAAM